MTLDVEEIWTNYSVQLRAYLAARLPDPADADDVLQDILIKSHKGLRNLRDPGRLKPWLYQIATTAIADFYRARGRGPEAIDLPDPETTPETTDETRIALEACVRPFLDALPADTARLLWAVDVDDQSQREVAQEAGLSYSTLKSRVKAGREKMRHLFESCCQLDLDARGTVMGCTRPEGDCGNC